MSELRDTGNPPVNEHGFDPIVDGGCDGSRQCRAVVHIHGCFADGGKCDDPKEHVECGSCDYGYPMNCTCAKDAG